MNNFNDSLAQYVNNSKQTLIQQSFRRAKAQQLGCIQMINNKFQYLQDSVSLLENTISVLEKKLKNISYFNEGSKLGELRDKQKQFIIFELEKKCKRLQQNQQSIQISLMQKQTLANSLQQKVHELRSQNNELRQELSKKIKQVKELVKTNSQLKMMETLSKNRNRIMEIQKYNAEKSPTLYVPNLSEASVKKQQANNRNQCYEQLQCKLKEIEDCLNGEIEQYKKKNMRLQQEIRRLNEQLKKQSGYMRRIYELQIKIKNLTSENKSLEECYTSQLAITNQNQIKFHKKMGQLKSQILQGKKMIKNNSKQIQKQLKKLSAAVLGVHDKSTIFLGTTNLSEQFEQLTKQIIKNHKKQINQISCEKNTIIEQLNLNIQNNRNKIMQLSTTVQKIKLRKNEIIEKAPIINGHGSSRNNTSKTEIELKQREKQRQRQKYEKLQQKYEHITKQLRSNLEARQKFITQMRKTHDQQETEMTNRLLQLQTKLAQKQMQLKYEQQKFNQFKNSNNQKQNSAKATVEKQLARLKQKCKQIQSQRDEIKAKYKQVQQKLYSKQKFIKQFDKKQKQRQEKLKRVEKRYQVRQMQLKKGMETKQRNIQQLIAKNQNLVIELKVAKQKIKITQSNLNSLKQQHKQPQTDSSLTQQKNSIRVIKNQFSLEKQQLQTLISNKQQQIQQLISQLEDKSQLLKKKQQKLTQLNAQLHKNDNDMKILKKQNQSLKLKQQKLKTTSEAQNQRSSNFALVRQQYQKRQKILKAQGQKIIQEVNTAKKQLKAQNKKLSQQITFLKQQNKKNKQQFALFEQQKLNFNSIKFKDSERERKLTKDYQNKIKQLNSKINQLQKNIQKYSNSTPVQQIPASSKLSNLGKNANIKRYKDTDSKQYVDFGIGTDIVGKNNQGVNTVDIFALQTQKNGNMNNILDFNQEQPEVLSSLNNPHEQQIRNSNLFMNLNDNNFAGDDVFEICDENEEVNLGQNQFKQQIRELFINLRIQIEKLFNQDEISFATTKLLPKGLQDDYYELMGYVKQKISQIKQHNEISFIMAEAGNEAQLQQLSFQLPGLIHRYASQGGGQSLRKIIQQKQALINSLMNQRNSQQNTINQLTMQKQEIQQQNENRFMNQCNVYKRQIKQHKKTIDVLQMNLQSLKNIIRIVLEAFCQDEDMEDDFRESMTLYVKVGQLGQRQRSKINYYIQKYLSIKGLTQ